MYSGAVQDKSHYVVYELYLDGERYDKFGNLTTLRDDWHILLSRFNLLDNTNKNIVKVMNKRFKGRIHDEQLDRLTSKIKSSGNVQETFPLWFENYVRESLNQEFDEIEVIKAWYEYDEGNKRLNRVSTAKLF